MKLFTNEISKKLTAGGSENMRPICKLFTPWGNATWLITGEEDGNLYGYADLGLGCVEWGSLFARSEVESIRGPFGLKVERDLYWVDKPEVCYFDHDSLQSV